MSKPDQTGTNGLSAPGDDFRTTRRSLLGAAAGALAAGATLGLTNQQSTAKASQQTAEPGQGDRQVLVYPSHDTRTASPFTEISFRGITEDELGAVDVAGSQTGGHTGIMKAHADGNGVSYLPDRGFEPGEQVTVRAGIPLAPDGDAALLFSVVRPVEVPSSDPNPVIDDPEEKPREYRSRPDLTPPRTEVTTAANGVAPGLVFVAPLVRRGQTGVLILDNAGEVIWWAPSPIDDVTYFNLRVQRYRNQPVLTWFEGPEPVLGGGVGHYVIADTSYEHIIEFQVGNGFTGGDLHEFVVTPRGTALISLYHVVAWDVSPVGGSTYGIVTDDIVQEVEIETGRVLFEWHSLDHVGLEESRVTASPNGDQTFDYFHLNSIEETPDGHIVISARHTCAIYKINRTNGKIIWRLNGTRSDFKMGAATEFSYQHDARVHPDGMLSLFDNNASTSDSNPSDESRGLVLALDEESMRATFVRQYVNPDKILSRAMGNMQMLPNGNVFVGWGSEPAFSEYSAEGELIFDCRFSAGSRSYRAYREEWIGQPSVPPDIAVESTAHDTVTVYASWNGATEVANWQVIAGESKENLKAAGIPTKRDGFETVIAVNVATKYYAVEALDADGNVLDTSTAVQPEASPRGTTRVRELRS